MPVKAANLVKYRGGYDLSTGMIPRGLFGLDVFVLETIINHWVIKVV